MVGGGPAGLMAAEQLLAAGIGVDLFESKGSVGRKFLIAGKGGLNLTHAESARDFVRRYREGADWVGGWLASFDADALRGWADELGVPTFVGSSGHVFPIDLKAAPLLRGWVRRLRAQGLRLHVNHRCDGWSESGALRFQTPEGIREFRPHATVFALGGGSWSKLGSDGAWVSWLSGSAACSVDIRPLRPANCGFELDWSDHLRARHAGTPLKPLRIEYLNAAGQQRSLRGEMMLTEHGLEGSLIYACAAELRELIDRQGYADIELDLCPDRSEVELEKALAAASRTRSLSEKLRRSAHLSGAKAALLREGDSTTLPSEVDSLARLIKHKPLRLLATRPIDEAISTAGGVHQSALDAKLMLLDRPGVFCCGEMLDWEAPTGGYLLTACFASGLIAGVGAALWLQTART